MPAAPTLPPSARRFLREIGEALPLPPPRPRVDEEDRPVPWMPFHEFLPLWHFTNRETGAIVTFGAPGEPCRCSRGGPHYGIGLWPGQERLAAFMEREPWVFALKAGKLGFTELECAYDGWVAICGQPNARVHLLSKDDKAAKSLLRYVKRGLKMLPDGIRLPTPRDAGADTTHTFMVQAGPDDIRIVESLATSAGVAIDTSAQHTHVDELSHTDGETVWNSVATTVPEGASIHIVTRGAGDQVYTARLWEEAGAGTSRLKQFFASWDERPDRTHEYRQSMAGTLTPLGLAYFLPETPADALMGDEDSPYITLPLWDSLADAELNDTVTVGGEERMGRWALMPGDRTPLVLALDAAVTRDSFAIVAVSRHPERRRDVAIRKIRLYRPQQFPDGRIDFEEVQRFVRFICQGGCWNGHPKSWGARYAETCVSCATAMRSGEWPVAKFNVVQICYDPYQLEEMSQQLRRDRVAPVVEFDQGRERLEADAQFYGLAMRGGIIHPGYAEMREHIRNAKAKIPKDEDSKMRIVKRSETGHIDLIVAASMASKRSLDLLL